MSSIAICNDFKHGNINEVVAGDGFGRGVVEESSLPKNLYRHSLLHCIVLITVCWAKMASSTVEIQHRIPSSDIFTVPDGDDLNRYWRCEGTRNVSSLNCWYRVEIVSQYFFCFVSSFSARSLPWTTSFQWFHNNNEYFQILLMNLAVHNMVLGFCLESTIMRNNVSILMIYALSGNYSIQFLAGTEAIAWSLVKYLWQDLWEDLYQ